MNSAVVPTAIGTVDAAPVAAQSAAVDIPTVIVPLPRMSVEREASR
jgi:hypothetical protein